VWRNITHPPFARERIDVLAQQLVRRYQPKVQNLGPNGTVLWKVLGRCARQSRKKTAHNLARRLPHEVHSASGLRDYLQREAIDSVEAFRQNTAPAITFRQAECWIASLPARKRRPVKPATISGWRDALNAWLLPNLGAKLLADVSNAAMRQLVEKMSNAGLSPKTIVNYVQVVKLVLTSLWIKRASKSTRANGITISSNSRSFEGISSGGPRLPKPI
jgi:hypothetical protein